MGIAMAGSGAGGLVFAPVTQSLLVRYSAPATLRILGVWNFVICIAISFVIRPHPAYKPIRPSLALATRGTFILQVSISRAHISTPAHPLNILPVIRGVLSGCWKHNTLVLSDHVLNLCARLLTYHGQHALGPEQRCQQRITRFYGAPS